MNNPPHDWNDVEFDDFGEIVAGGTPSRAVPSFWNGDIPWVTPSEITALKNKHLRETREQITREGLASSAATLLPPGTLLVTSRATLGAVAIAGVSVTTNQGFKNIIPNEETDSLFAYYRIGTLKPEMERRASGTTFLEISKADFSRIRTLRPNRVEQSRIAAVLDTIDEAIAKTEAVIAKLKQVRAGLLHDLLTRGLDENGQLRDPVAHPEQFQDSPIGRIPRGWEISRLGGCSSLITSGSRGWAAHYSKDGPMFLRIGNLTREHINLRFDDVVRVCPPTGSEGARTKVEAGDILISITADLGIIGVIPSFFGEAYVNQHIALIRPNRKIVSRWLGRFLASGPGAKQFQMLNDTGAKAGLNGSLVFQGVAKYNTIN